VGLPPVEEQEPVEMHSPVGPLAPIVHFLFELGGGGAGVETQHFSGVSDRYLRGRI
jgi:hypothetical protein